MSQREVILSLLRLGVVAAEVGWTDELLLTAGVLVDVAFELDVGAETCALLLGSRPGSRL
jgi:hypothetical protein